MRNEAKMDDSSKQRVVAALNKILGLELQAIIQYKVQSVMAGQPSGVALAGQVEDVALQEMQHAEKIMERIDFLGGIPVTYPAPITIGDTDIKAIAAVDTIAEDVTQKAYTDAIGAAVECNDITTKELLKSILSDEEGHAYFFQQVDGEVSGPSEAPVAMAAKQRKASHRTREHMDVPFELKSLDENGHFEGHASVFGNVDLGNDMVDAGAYKRTIDKNPGGFPILFMHDMAKPVGLTSSASEDAYGLKIMGDLDLDTQLGRDVYSGLQKGYIDCMSIGYEAVQKEAKEGVRHLKEIALYEVSLLTKGFAMNPAALVTAVKAIGDMDAEELSSTFAAAIGTITKVAPLLSPETVKDAVSALERALPGDTAPNEGSPNGAPFTGSLDEAALNAIKLDLATLELD